MARVALGLLMLASAACQARASFQTGSIPADTPTTPSSTVTLALLGDVMLGRDVHPSSESFAYLKPYLTSADLALANLESPLTTSRIQTVSPYVLCAPPENARFLAQAGFDLLALANNHSLDCGPDGLRETQDTLKNAGLGFIGPDFPAVYRSINGIQLAFLAFDEITGLDVARAAQAVRSASDTGAIVVVSMHWGMEYQAGASARQEQIAKELADAGASLIWGHHPHVLQSADWLNDKKNLVFYSLGNALFDQYGLESTRQSALVLAILDSKGPKEFSVIPFLIDYQDSRVLEAGYADSEHIMQYFK